MPTHSAHPAAAPSVTPLPAPSGKKAKGSRETRAIAATLAKGQDAGVKWDHAKRLPRSPRNASKSQGSWWASDTSLTPAPAPQERSLADN